MSSGDATYPAIAVEEQSFLTRVMAWMFAGLAVTGAIAWAVGSSEDMLAWFDAHFWVFVALLIVELAAVFGLSLLVERMSPTLAGAVFLAYAAMNGVTFSIFFSIYTTSSIVAAFFVTSAMFGALAVYGYTTKRDLSTLGSVAFMALIGLILASVVNLVWANDTLYWINTYAGVLIFAALTAYDMQKIKQINVRGNVDSDADRREAIMGALALYLDFINLFLRILRIMGRRK